MWLTDPLTLFLEHVELNLQKELINFCAFTEAKKQRSGGFFAFLTTKYVWKAFENISPYICHFQE